MYSWPEGHSHHEEWIMGLENLHKWHRSPKPQTVLSRDEVPWEHLMLTIQRGMDSLQGNPLVRIREVKLTEL